MHLICSILQPLRADPSGLPTLEADVQDAFVEVVKTVTQKLEQYTLASHASDDITDLVVIIARLWQFDLCLPGAWTRRLKDNVSEVLVSILKLAIVCRHYVFRSFFLLVGLKLLTEVQLWYNGQFHCVRCVTRHCVCSIRR